MYDTLDKYKTPLRYPNDESSDIYDSIRTTTTTTTLSLTETGEPHHKSLKNNQICHEEENKEFLRQQPLRARANTAPAAIYDSVNTNVNDDKYNITSFSRRRKIGVVKGMLYFLILVYVRVITRYRVQYGNELRCSLILTR